MTVGPESFAPAPVDRVAPTYILAPGDIIAVQVRGQPDLSNTLTIRPDGRVSIPLADDVMAAGLTPLDLTAALEERLAPFIQNPIVTVTVTSAGGAFEQQIRVIGMAAGPDYIGGGSLISRQPAQPRAIRFVEGITLLDVINQVGGLSPFADGNSAYIQRQVDGTQTRIAAPLDDLIEESDITKNIRLEPGDTIVVPESYFSGVWTTTFGMGAFLTFTDNVNLTPDEFKNSALIFSLTPSISTRGASPRVAGGLDAQFNLNFREVFGDNNLDTREGFDPTLTLLGTFTGEVVRDVLFADLGASISQQSNDFGSGVSRSEFVNANERPVATFRFSPYVPLRFGQNATSQFRYTLTGTVEGESDFNIINTLETSEATSIQHRFDAAVSSGDAAADFGAWTLSGYVSRELRSERDDIDSAAAQVDYAFPIQPRLVGIATVGWQYRDAGQDGRRINDPIGAAGVRWTPNRRLTLGASVGQRDGRFNVAFNSSYQISPRSQFFANYAEGEGTTAQLAAGNLGFLAVNPITGNFVDNRTRSPFEQRFLGNISTESSFNRAFRAGFSTQQNRSTFNTTFRFISQEQDDEDEAERRFNLEGRWRYQLSLRSNTSVSFTVGRNDLITREDTTIGAGARYSYSVLQNVSLSASYDFQKRFSTLSTSRFTENVGTIGISGNF